VDSLVAEFIPAQGIHPVAQLARAWDSNFQQVDAERKEMMDVGRNMALQWNFTQTVVDIGIPTMAKDPHDRFPDGPDAIGFVRPVVFRFDYQKHPILLPTGGGWSVEAVFGGSAPPSPGFALRICLYGERVTTNPMAYR
jgi:hypothetical protein